MQPDGYLAETLAMPPGTPWEPCVAFGLDTGFLSGLADYLLVRTN